MTLPKRYLTILVNVALAFVATVITYYTDWFFVIPVLFALGIPLINIDKPLRYKAPVTLGIIALSILIFSLGVLATLNIDYDRYVLQGLVMGAAGVLTLVANGLLIKTVRITLSTILITFLLAGISFPLWIFAESLLPKTIADISIIPEFGSMMFWMTLTTIGIATGINDPEQEAQNANEIPYRSETAV
jgi:hypothetical protein